MCFELLGLIDAPQSNSSDCCATIGQQPFRTSRLHNWFANSRLSHKTIQELGPYRCGAPFLHQEDAAYAWMKQPSRLNESDLPDCPEDLELLHHAGRRPHRLSDYLERSAA
jgi:hypothetical protein